MNDIDLLKENIYSDISKIVLKIKNCHSKTSYNVLLSELMVLYNLADKFDVVDIPDIDDFSFKTYSIDELKIIKKIISKYQNSYKDNRKIITNYKKILTKNNYNVETEFDRDFLISKKISLQENLEIVNDFFKEFDSQSFDYFIKLCKDNRVAYNICDIKQIESYGTTYLGYDNYMPYMLIESPENILSAITLVHEIGHLSDYNKSKSNSNKHRINKNLNNCLEINSHFYELVFYDFLEKNNICNEDLKNIKIGYFEHLFVNICDFDNLLNKNISTINDAYDNYNEIIDIPEYVYGKIFALCFYDKYNSDNKKGLESINKFISNSGVFEYKSFDDILSNMPFTKEIVIKGKTLKKILKSK